MLVLFFGELSFEARGGLQKPVVRENSDAAILAAVPVFFRDSTCHDSGGVGQVGALVPVKHHNSSGVWCWSVWEVRWSCRVCVSVCLGVL